MNRDDIIKMAREVGIDATSDTLCRYEGWIEPLERFAALVAVAEREACAQIAFNAKTYIEAAAAIRSRGEK